MSSRGREGTDPHRNQEKREMFASGEERRGRLVIFDQGKGKKRVWQVTSDLPVRSPYHQPFGKEDGPGRVGKPQGGGYSSQNKKGGGSFITSRSRRTIEKKRKKKLFFKTGATSGRMAKLGWREEGVKWEEGKDGIHIYCIR